IRTSAALITYSRPIQLSRTCMFFSFNDTATTEIYTLSLHDALPILIAETLQPRRRLRRRRRHDQRAGEVLLRLEVGDHARFGKRSEEHTSELQSPYDLVCRLLLEKKKIQHKLLDHYLLISSHSYTTL